MKRIELLCNPRSRSMPHINIAEDSPENPTLPVEKGEHACLRVWGDTHPPFQCEEALFMLATARSFSMTRDCISIPISFRSFSPIMLWLLPLTHQVVRAKRLHRYMWPGYLTGCVFLHAGVDIPWGQ